MASGRFAPSPTGDLHLGNLRTATLAWLWSRHDGDGFVVRMEDLDRATSSPQNEERQLHDLAQVGLDWDGEVVRQSDRFDRYASAIDDLERAGRVYRCYCTRKEIAAAATAPNEPNEARYPGTCRALTAAQRRGFERAGRPPALRFRADGGTVAFNDAVLGTVARRPDDIVIRRNDGVPAYHLAVVVDDDAQAVSLVVRGDDLAHSTASQISLSSALGLSSPRYAHVPLVLSESGKRLAKRDGSVTLTDRVALGDTPLTVTRWLLASCGQMVDDSESPSEALRHAASTFDPSSLPRHPITLTGAVLAQSLPSRP